jgi:putative transcriptional regulator
VARSVKGSLLIAQPGLVDPNFRSTVVLVTEHNDQGAFGLVLNREGEHKIADLWRNLTGKPCASEALAFVGGPVQPGAVFILHTREDLAVGAEPVIPGLYLGSSVELLGSLLEAEESAAVAPEQRFRVFCGYAGWGAGQLDGELKAGGWIVQPASTEFIFETPPHLLWQRTMDRQGGVYKFFAFMPPKPELN